MQSKRQALYRNGFYFYGDCMLFYLKVKMWELVFSQINTGNQCQNKILHSMEQLTIYIKLILNTLGLA